MSENAQATNPGEAGTIMEQVIAKGDLTNLSPAERARYYVEVCKSVGVNPLTSPFQYLTLNGKLTLYATRGCTDQLRRLHNVSTTIVARERQEDVYVVTARATLPDGRTDESIGAVTIGQLKGDALANGLMKAESKAKRRATLAIVGLGWLDESELETIVGGKPVPVDTVAVAQVVSESRAEYTQAGTPVSPAEASTAVESVLAPLCHDCEQAIPAVLTARGTASPDQVATASTRRFGRALCQACGKKEQARLDRLAHEQAISGGPGREAE